MAANDLPQAFRPLDSSLRGSYIFAGCAAMMELCVIHALPLMEIMMAAKKSLLSEKEIEQQESFIPVVAASATRAADFRALTSGLEVLLVRGANLIEARADGSITVVGKSKPKRKVTVGQVVAVRRVCQNESKSARA